MVYPIDSDFVQIQIWQPLIARQNVQDPSECCECLLVSNRSRITNAVSGCRENWETMCLCDSVRGSENENSVSQFSRQQLIAFEPRFVFPDQPNTHKRIIYACKGQKYSFAQIWDGDFQRELPLLAMHETTLSPQCFSNISATTNPFRAQFRVFGTIQHAWKSMQGPKSFCSVNYNLSFRE